ncbi:MAG TPA: methyltransferase [Methanoregula sp.]|nr:methyltransferase [Methanoregula sp.]
MCDTTTKVPDLSAVPELPGTSPLAFLDSAFAGVRQYHAVMTALDLGLFELLEEPMSVEECAERTGCRKDMTGLLCAALASLGLLEKAGEKYRTAPPARTFLARDSPFSQHHAVAFQRRLGGLWEDLPAIMRNGPVTYEKGEMFRDVIIPSMAENCRCGLLQKVTAQVAALPEFSSAQRLLDLGGGHGLYAIAFCQKNPGLKATVFDLPPVTGATHRFIDRYRADRVSVMPGDFFADPIGSGYDIVFSSSNLGGKVPALIPKIADALVPGGLFINKQAIDEEEADPWTSLEWNLWTFAGVQKQVQRYAFRDSVPLAEYNRCLEENGFVVQQTIPVDTLSVMTIARKTGVRGE